MSLPVVEVVRRRGLRAVEPPASPMPETVVAVLDAIVRDMRDVPRDCLRDPAELLHWLRRMANRVEGVATMKLPEPARLKPSGPSRLPRPVHTAPTARQAAEAVFTSTSKPCAAKGLKDETLRAASAPTTGKSQAVARRPDTRTVVSRKGRAVPVEIRRARAGGQMEMSF